nr:hypothetical protein [Tsukamurella tyrosinosolvens]
MDFDPGEECLVVEAAMLIRCGEISGVAVARVPKGDLQVGLDGTELDVGCGEPGIDVGQLARDAILLALKEVERHGIGVMRTEELRAFGKQTIALDGQVAALQIGSEPGAAQLCGQQLTNGSLLRGGELHSAVRVLDQFLDRGDMERLLLAGCPLLLTPYADVVRVDASLAVLGHRDDEARTT